VAEQQVVAEREHHPDHDFERQVLVEPDLAEPQRRAREQRHRHQHRGGDERRGTVGGRHEAARMKCDLDRLECMFYSANMQERLFQVSLRS
jgi:hypothetical protein